MTTHDASLGAKSQRQGSPPQDRRSRWRAIGEREPLLIDLISAGLPKQFRSVDQETIQAAPAVPIDSPYTISFRQMAAFTLPRRIS